MLRFFLLQRQIYLAHCNECDVYAILPFEMLGWLGRKSHKGSCMYWWSTQGLLDKSIHQMEPQIHTCKLSKVLDLLTNDVAVVLFVQCNMMFWVLLNSVRSYFGVCAHCCEKLWADLRSKARLRQKDLIQKQTMDHCSSHNKHLACDAANRPMSSTGSELPSAPRTRRTGCLMKMRGHNRKTKAG